MKTFVIAATAATITAGAALAHPVNEPHICGIDPTMVMDYPGFAQENGTIYDRGTYFFIATNNNDLSGEYTTTHTRIFKDDCRVVGVDIFHKNDEELVVEAPIVEELVIPEDSRTVHTYVKYWHEDFHNRESNKYKTTLTVRTITDVTDGVTSELTRRVRTNENGRKFVTVDNHTTRTAQQWAIKPNGDIVKPVQPTGYKEDRDVSESWLDSKPSRSTDNNV